MRTLIRGGGSEINKIMVYFFKTGAFYSVVWAPYEAPPHARRSERRPFALAAGIRAVGGKLPGVVRLGAELQVSQTTVRAALRKLEAEGLLADSADSADSADWGRFGVGCGV